MRTAVFGLPAPLIWRNLSAFLAHMRVVSTQTGAKRLSERLVLGREIL